MNQANRKNSTAGILCAIGCETLYGLSYIFTKQATACASELVLQESFTGYQIAGAIVIIAGVYTANIKK